MTEDRRGNKRLVAYAHRPTLIVLVALPVVSRCGAAALGSLWRRAATFSRLWHMRHLLCWRGRRVERRSLRVGHRGWRVKRLGLRVGRRGWRMERLNLRVGRWGL